MTRRGTVGDTPGERAELLARDDDADHGGTDRGLQQAERGPASADAAPPVRERADTDVWLVRPDLGAGVRVLVRAGDLIPYGAEQHAREPVQPGELP